MLIVFVVQLHLLINVIPEEKEACEKCNWKILCETGLLDRPECKIYKNTYIPDVANITID